MTILDSILAALFTFAMVFAILITLMLLIRLTNYLLVLITGKKPGAQGGNGHV